MNKEDWCKCSDDIPINWLGTCESCGKKYLFPGKRKRVTHPLPFEQAWPILEDTYKRDQAASYRGLENSVWNETWEKMLDAEMVSLGKGFFILGSGIFCGPRLYGFSHLYFTTRQGAEAWRDLKYARAQYDILICEALPTKVKK